MSMCNEVCVDLLTVQALSVSGAKALRSRWPHRSDGSKGRTFGPSDCSFATVSAPVHCVATAANCTFGIRRARVEKTDRPFSGEGETIVTYLWGASHGDIASGRRMERVLREEEEEARALGVLWSSLRSGSALVAPPSPSPPPSPLSSWK